MNDMFRRSFLFCVRGNGLKDKEANYSSNLTRK